jgi:phosphomannomutase
MPHAARRAKLAAATTDLTLAGSIMLTASHMPLQNNGLKFFTAEGGLAKPDIAQILALAAERAAAAGVKLGDGMQVSQ